jgi:hypothetical protein
LESILEKGTLATRILNALKDDFSEKKIKEVYQELAVCLEQNRLFK